MPRLFKIIWSHDKSRVYCLDLLSIDKEKKIHTYGQKKKIEKERKKKKRKEKPLHWYSKSNLVDFKWYDEKSENETTGKLQGFNIIFMETWHVLADKLIIARLYASNAFPHQLTNRHFKFEI